MWRGSNILKSQTVGHKKALPEPKLQEGINKKKGPEGPVLYCVEFFTFYGSELPGAFPVVVFISLQGMIYFAVFKAYCVVYIMIVSTCIVTICAMALRPFVENFYFHIIGVFKGGRSLPRLLT